MIEIEVGRGDEPAARELVAAMEAWVSEGFGPATPDRTSTVDPEEMVPPSGAFVIVREDGRRARLDTALSMTTAMALYESGGYRPIEDYNGNSYASFWGEKEL